MKHICHLSDLTKKDNLWKALWDSYKKFGILTFLGFRYWIIFKNHSFHWGSESNEVLSKMLLVSLTFYKREFATHHISFLCLCFLSPAPQLLLSSQHIPLFYALLIDYSEKRCKLLERIKVDTAGVNKNREMKEYWAGLNGHPWGFLVTHPWPLPSQIMPKASKQLFKADYLLGLFIHFHLNLFAKW